MNTFDNLFSRRSIRTYNGENITEAELDLILKAAYASPVGRALFDTLNLTVISNRDYLSKWEDYCENESGHKTFLRSTDCYSRFVAYSVNRPQKC